jgi:hypothetical protein
MNSNNTIFICDVHMGIVKVFHFNTTIFKTLKVEKKNPTSFC